mmetsp:Transcript_119595/g.333727  ORF Transcript_119595/g.333727 Transcript_119595/m.333727 type:complete len:254 (+) Transcript_119595:321-1082(+)
MAVSTDAGLDEAECSQEWPLPVPTEGAGANSSTPAPGPTLALRCGGTAPGGGCAPSSLKCARSCIARLRPRERTSADFTLCGRKPRRTSSSNACSARSVRRGRAAPQAAISDAKKYSFKGWPAASRAPMTSSTLSTSPTRAKALQIVPNVTQLGVTPRPNIRRKQPSTPFTSPTAANPLSRELNVTMSGFKPQLCMRSTCHSARATSPLCVQAFTTMLQVSTVNSCPSTCINCNNASARSTSPLWPQLRIMLL